MSDLQQQALLAGQLAHDTEIVRAEYPDLMADPRLAGMAHVTVAALQQRDLQHGRLRAPLEIYREAGDSVRELVGKPRHVEPDPAERAQAYAEQAAERQHNVVLEMKRQRGQL